MGPRLAVIPKQAVAAAQSTRLATTSRTVPNRAAARPETRLPTRKAARQTLIMAPVCEWVNPRSSTNVVISGGTAKIGR